MSGLELSFGVTSFAKASSLDACSGPSVSLSSDLGDVETVP